MLDKPAERLHTVLDATGKHRFGRQAVLGVDRNTTRSLRDVAQAVLVLADVANHKAAAMDEHERGRTALVALGREDVQGNAPVAKIHDDGLLGNARAPHDMGLLVGRGAPRDHVHRPRRRRTSSELRVGARIDARIEHVLALISRHGLQ